MAKRKLTPRQERFVQEYLVDLNATQAAVRAGYSQATANQQAARMLAKVNIRAALEAERKALSQRTEVTQDRIIRELAQIAFSDATAYDSDDEGRVTLRDGTEPEATRALASVKRKKRTVPGGEGACVEEVEFRLWNKVDALKLLGQHLGMFKERVELSGTGAGGAIQHEHRASLAADDLAAAIAFAREAGFGVSPDGGAEPLDPVPAPPEAGEVPAPF